MTSAIPLRKKDGGLACPSCGQRRAVSGRIGQHHGLYIRRMRHCQACGYHFRTIEMPIPGNIVRVFIAWKALRRLAHEQQWRKNTEQVNDYAKDWDDPNLADEDQLGHEDLLQKPV